jgi:hypothetical protein
MSVPGGERDGGDGGFSASGWVDAALHAALARALPAILEPARPFRPRGLVLSGSAALGEAVGWEADDPAERLVLSDLDLGLVTADRVPEGERIRIVAAAGAAGTATASAGVPGAIAGAREAEKPAGVPTPAPGAAVFPKVEVTLGFYETSWWSRQTPTPGGVDARSRGIVVWGDITLPARLLGPVAGRVPPWEAVRLVGNRALELLAAPDPHSRPAPGPRGWYALAKAVTSLWTARLIGEGRYRVGWSGRRILLEEEAQRTNAGAADAVVRGVLAWAPFLDRPCARTLPMRAAWLPAYRDALETWLASLPPDLRGPGEPVESAFLAEPVSLRERWRAWRAEGRRAGGRARWPGGSGGYDALPVRLAWAPGTPGGRRMAAAVLYWRDLPERPELSWGESPLSAFDAPAWEERIRRLLGRPVPAGPGCRSRLMAALGLEAATAMDVQGGRHG